MSMKVERVVIPSAGELRLLEAEDALRKYAVAAQAKDERIEQLEALARDYEYSCGGACCDCDQRNPEYPEASDEMCLLSMRFKALAIGVE